MDDLSFLETFGECGASNATLKAVLASGQVCHISDHICPYNLIDACPLLYHAFEYGFHSRLQASIDAPSRSAVVSLVRYCYTGSYLSAEEAEYAPILLLPHAETYKLAEDFNVPALQLLAQGNFSCQVDFACCLPAPPQDLLETIKFVYHHYAAQLSRQQHSLVNTILNYCISNFLYHRLAENTDFLAVVADIPEFRQDLCRTNMERNFQDDCAVAIVRLALDALPIYSGPPPTLLSSKDLPQEMLYDIPHTPPYEKAEVPSCPADNEMADVGVAATSGGESGDNQPLSNIPMGHLGPNVSISNTIAYRYRNPPSIKNLDLEPDSSSDEEGFSLVYRPKTLALAAPDEPMSSPELIPSAPIDILAATGSNYPTDDEWTML
ncbi:hypothetical protein BKA66DRAFT_420212 [Pyrenochaeta sp. MPI-SDFR-AT-0127]|nr:hypothetical protein BKA66DRAFT_420212 [Pyrenochaeta sp. MPI-SDFR-AT-0127]